MANTTNQLTAADVTKAPKMRPTTQDGVRTGMWVTLEDSVALGPHGPMAIAAGTLVTSASSGGYHSILGSNYEARKIGLSGHNICYRA